MSNIDAVLTELDRRQRIRRIFGSIGAVALIGLTVAGATFLGFTLADLVRQFPRFVTKIGEFITPDFYYFTVYSVNEGLHGWSALFESLIRPGTLLDSILLRNDQSSIVGFSLATIVIGFTGTVIGFPLALLFGVLGSERVTPFPFNFIFRGTMSTIRAIPALVWVLIYVPLAGITPVSAMLAVGTDTIGNLGRLFTDELEEIDEGPIEAINSTGASGSQTVVFGMLSQVSTSFIACGLGVVGAGGIGQYISGRIGLLNFSQAAAGILMVIVIVLSVEMTSSRLRARLRPSEHESKSLLDSLRDLGDGSKWFGSRVEKE